jgi:hypothetical protein
VDHPLPVSDALVRPWRTAAYIAATIAVVELLVLLAIGGNALVGAASDRLRLAAQERALAPPAPTTTRRARKTTPIPAAKLPRPRTTVVVLNGNGRAGAAAAAASRVHARGYRIGSVGNAPRQVARSLVMYKPGFSGEGRRLAKDLGVRAVGPLDGMRARELGRAQLVLVLGT